MVISKLTVLEKHLVLVRDIEPELVQSTAFPKIPDPKMSKLDYLKRYMSKDEDDDKSKKKKKKSKKDHPTSG